MVVKSWGRRVGGSDQIKFSWISGRVQEIHCPSWWWQSTTNEAWKLPGEPSVFTPHAKMVCEISKRYLHYFSVAVIKTPWSRQRTEGRLCWSWPSRGMNPSGQGGRRAEVMEQEFECSHFSSTSTCRELRDLLKTGLWTLKATHSDVLTSKTSKNLPRQHRHPGIWRTVQIQTILGVIWHSACTLENNIHRSNTSDFYLRMIMFDGTRSRYARWSNTVTEK